MTAVVTTAPAPRPTAGHHGSFWRVTWAIGTRGLLRMRRLPSLILPAVFMPVFFVVAFSGSFSAVTDIRGYGTDQAVNWMAAWAMLQGSAFAGVGAAGSVATDLENGFFDRLLLAPTDRLALMAGSVLYGQIRSLIPITLVLGVSFALGADIPGGLPGLGVMYVGCVAAATVMALFGLTIVYRMQTLQSLAVIQIGIFTFMFMSIGQAPLVAIEGWLHSVARVNPMTNVIRLVRQGFLGDVTWSTTWPGLLALAGLIVFFGALAMRGLSRIRP